MSTTINQEAIKLNSSLWPKVEKSIKYLIIKSCFYEYMHEDVLSEVKIIFLQNNKTEFVSRWFLKKTVLLACCNLGLYRPKAKAKNIEAETKETQTDELQEEVQTEKITFTSLEKLQESGFDVVDPRYFEKEESDRLDTLLEYALTDPMFVKALQLVKEGHDLSEVARLEGISCSGLWQFLRREGQRTLEEINSPQMRLISASEIKVKAKSRPVTASKNIPSTTQQLPLFVA